MASKKEKIEIVLADPEKLKKAADKAFESNDIDNSGQLERNEVVKWLQEYTESLGVMPIEEESIDRIIDILDRDDGDGLINRDEFEVLMKAMLTVALKYVDE